MIAAVLDLHISPGSSTKALDQMARGLRYGHDVVDYDFLSFVRPKTRGAQGSKRLQLKLFLVADDAVHLVHASELVRIDLRRAAGNHDLGAWALPARLTDRLTGLAHGLIGHRTRVDNHGVDEASIVRVLAHDCGLERIDPATKGDDVQFRHVAAFNRIQIPCQTPCASPAASKAVGSVSS